MDSSLDRLLITINNSELTRTDFKQQVVQTFLNKVAEKYANRYSFEGDDNFTPLLQKRFFTALFYNGIAGLYKSKKYDNPIIVNVFPFARGTENPYDLNGSVLNAKGVPYFKRNNNQRFIKENLITLNRENCAFYEQINALITPEPLSQKIKVFAIKLAEMYIEASHINKQQANKHFVNNEKSSGYIIKQLSDITNNFVKIQSTNDNSADISKTMESLNQAQAKMLSVLQYSSNLESHLSAIEKYTSLIFSLFGIRHTQTFKKQRMIAGEVENDTNEYRLNEYTQLVEIENFILNYKKVFNKELKLVDNIAGDEEKTEQEEEINNEVISNETNKEVDYDITR